MTHKIIHLTTSHNPYDTRILKRECATLAENPDYDVMLMNAFGINESTHGVTIKSFDKRRSRLARYSVSIVKAILAIKDEKPSVVHLHDPELFLLTGIFKKMGVLVVVDVHEKYADKFFMRDWVPAYLQYSLSSLFRAMLKRVDQSADGIVTATPYLLEDFKNNNKHSIRNLPDLRYISNVTNNSLRKENLIIYTGGLTENRGIEQVIRAMVNSDKNWSLHIYGKTSQIVKNRLGSLLDDPRIEVKGMASFEEIVTAMQQATVGVVCNEKGKGYENALPNKLFEYMAAGLAVVCTNFIEWQKLVEGNRVGTTCDPDDEKSVLSAVNSYLWNEAEVSIAGKNGRDLIKNSYSWKNEKEKLFDIYNEVLG